MALFLGYKKAYTIDVVAGIAAVIIALSLEEIPTGLSAEKSMTKRLREVIGYSISFLKNNPRALAIILFNNLIGAVSVLILFFMQARLPSIGQHLFR